MQAFKTGSVSANRLNFHYLEAGNGPLVLCLHGFPDHARSFRHQLAALAEAGFRAIAPYMRGYAPTDVPAEGPFQTAMLGKDAIALIDALSPNDPAVIVGHDWGALAAYGAALLAPERLKQLVIIAVPYGPQVMQAVMTNYEQTRRSWHMYLFQLSFAEAIVSHNDFQFIDRIWQDWSPGWTSPAEEMAALKATFRKPGVLKAALDYYRHAFNPALHQPDLAEVQLNIMNAPIEVPSLVFHGDRDTCIGVEQIEGMEAFFPKGLRKAIVPETGHFLHQEKPELVNRVLVEFLSEAR